MDSNKYYDDLVNVFIKYYNETINPKPDGKPNNYHLFNNIDYTKKESTNDIMEHLYEEILKFKMSKEEDATIYEYEMDHYHANNKYILILNGSPNKSCNIVFPILSYLSSIDWMNNEWKIETI